VLLSLRALQEAEGGALASFTGTMRYSSGLIADEKRTAAALVRVSKMMGKVRWHLAWPQQKRQHQQGPGRSLAVHEPDDKFRPS
jgi:hypothetical protein